MTPRPPILAAGLRLALLGIALGLPACQLDVRLKRLPREDPVIVQVASDGGSPRLEPAVLIEGARVFDERCSPCHGAEGHGDGPLASVVAVRPRDYHGDPFKWGTRPSQIVATIRGGRSGIMPPFEGVLTPREMWSVAYVVWSWIPEDRREMDPVEPVTR